MPPQSLDDLGLLPPLNGNLTVIVTIKTFDGKTELQVLANIDDPIWSLRPKLAHGLQVPGTGLRFELGGWNENSTLRDCGVGFGTVLKLAAPDGKGEEKLNVQEGQAVEQTPASYGMEWEGTSRPQSPFSQPLIQPILSPTLRRSDAWKPRTPRASLAMEAQTANSQPTVLDIRVLVDPFIHLSLIVSPLETVHNLKEEIHTRLGYSPASQVLHWRSSPREVMKDKHSLERYGVGTHQGRDDVIVDIQSD